MSNSLWPLGLPHARPPCPSPTPGSLLKLMSIESVMPSNPLILCHPLLLLSQSFPASVSFPMSQLFASGGQSTGASASASVLPMNIQDWFPLGLTSWISLQSKGLSRVFSNTTILKHQFFGAQPSLWSNSLYLTTGKTIALTIHSGFSENMSKWMNTKQILQCGSLRGWCWSIYYSFRIPDLELSWWSSS